MKHKCLCPSESHGHSAGKCKNVATKPDGLCKPCHDNTAEELFKMARKDRPLRSLSKRERKVRRAQ
jgi:hypothetical protein